MAEQEVRRYVLDIPGSPLSPNERRRAHWTVQARDSKTYRGLARLLAAAEHQGPPFERAHVVATLLRARGPALDPDGAVGRLKPLIDGLVDAGVLCDDDEAHLWLDVRQEKAQARGVRLEIEELSSA